MRPSKRNSSSTYFLFLVVVLTLAAMQTLAAGSPMQDMLPGLQEDDGRMGQANIQMDIAELPLSFIANAGQADTNVRFMVKAGEQTIFFTPQEIVFAASEHTEDEVPRSSVVRLRFAGANGEVEVEGEKPLPGVANFFLGNDPDKWKANVPTYAVITYHYLYSGIDLIYSGKQGRLKSEFVVAPSVDPTAITMVYSGASQMYVREDGALVLETPIGELVEEAPVIYQMIDEERVTVEGGYRLLGNGQVAFALGDYVPTQPLIIDPALVYSTYLGGIDDDQCWDIAVDDSGNAYITGSTYYGRFPAQDLLRLNHRAGDDDAFVAKLNPSGSAFVYSTYLGGSGIDQGEGIAVDSSGNVYVTGGTYSEDFPTKNPLRPTYGGEHDVFVTKIDPSGSILVYSTYLGGSKDDRAAGIAIDSSGNAYVTGGTTGWSGDFPIKDALQPSSGGGEWDAFLVKVNPTGSDLVYSTYLGGSGFDWGYSVTVDCSGNVYVIGQTGSEDFPTKDALQSVLGGGWDAFVTKVDPSGSGLIYSTYLGGSDVDKGNGIAVDSSGNAYVTGNTTSADFPTKDALQPVLGGDSDAFVTKVVPSGSALIYSTYLGGSKGDQSSAIAVDSSGNVYITGRTESLNFPTKAAFQPGFGGGSRIYGAFWFNGDAFVVKVDCTTSDLVYSTYLGGTGGDQGYSIAVDFSGSVYVVGFTNSEDFPTQVALQPAFGGGYFGDVFVAKIAK